MQRDFLRNFIWIAALLAVCAAVVVWGESGVDGGNRLFVEQLTAAVRIKYGIYALAYVLCVAAFMLLITRRVLFSLATSAAVFGAITAISRTKYQFLETKLVFSDLVFHATSPAEIAFFANHYFAYAVVGCMAMVAGLLGLWFIFRADSTRAPRWAAGLLLICAIVSVGLATRYLLHPVDLSYVFVNAVRNSRHVSGFLISAHSFAISQSEPLSLGPPVADAALELPVQTEDGTVRPDIIVILHESAVDPAIYFEGDQFRVSPALFTSGDGQRRRLLVNVFGGRTWVSEYGLNLGLDMTYLRAKENYIGVIGEGEFRSTLAQNLQALGYRTAALYPSPLTFLNTGRFYKSIGYDKVFSPDEMGLHIQYRNRQRDRAYYEFMLGNIAAADDKPTFHMVWTTATHGPYDFTMFDDVRPEEVSDDPRAEYARRQRIAADDLAWLKAELAARFPNRQFLIAGFGDHHPGATAVAYNGKGGSDVKRLPQDEGQFKTFYRIDGVNFDPDFDALSPEIQIGFLGESILTAARLPLDKAGQVRNWLRMKCGGLWSNCPDGRTLGIANTLLQSGDSSLFTHRRQ